MARTLNPTTHAVRRDEILDAAERRIRTSGYEAMGIQDLQDDLGVSRGAIYHYFDSKEAILAAVIERMTDAAMAVVNPVADAPEVTAVAKLQAVFATGGAWKAQRSDLLMALLRSWYSPANDLVRFRAQAASFRAFRPLMTRIIRQGVAEGAMDPTNPDHAATLIAGLFTGSADVIFDLLRARLDDEIPFEEVQRFMRAYDEALERILGLPHGSFRIIDDASLTTWFA